MQKGKFTAYVYTSASQIPIRGALVAVSAANADGVREIKGVRVTDANGKIEPIELDTPDYADSLSPEEDGKNAQPFAVCDVRIDDANYESVIIENVQVFAQTTTVQNVEMIPLRENAAVQDDVQIFNVTAQNL